MRRLTIALALVLILAFSASAQDATAEPDVMTEAVTLRDNAPDASGIQLTLVANGFFKPIAVVSAYDGSGRLFLVEQNGRIWILQDGQILETPFLDLTDRVSQSVTRGYSELGLLGLAFAPDYAESGDFYVHYNDRNNTSILAQYKVSEDANIADRSTEAILLTQNQPYANHNGGEITFSPVDGYLYLSFGDGGSQGDPQNTGQNPADWLGSILRIDVDGEGGYSIPDTNPYNRDASYGREVWAYGLRNAWRFSFDRATGDAYIADVGQNQWEEINFQPADSLGGANYGWADFEASQPYNVGTAPENMVYPFFEYAHGEGRCSVTGGYVYRGEAVPDLEGVYLFGDYCSGDVWASWRDTAETWQTIELMNVGFQISSFGQDEAGEVYIVDHNGNIYRFDPA